MQDWDGHTLNPNMDIVLCLFDFSGGVVFVGFGEGVYRGGDWLALCKMPRWQWNLAPRRGKRRRMAAREPAVEPVPGVAMERNQNRDQGRWRHTVGLEIFD